MKELNDGELLIFIGHSKDASAEAKAIYELQADFQKKLKDRTKVMDDPPFSSVKVWEWNYDAGGLSGGQDVLVDPHLGAAHFAVFVFKERVGRETWRELERCRERRDDRPPVAAVFPEQPPSSERMQELSAANDWATLLSKKRELSENFGKPNNIAVRPLDDYNDTEDLKRIVMDQFERDLGDIINRARMIVDSLTVNSHDRPIDQINEIYHEVKQISFDRCPMKNYSIDDLNQEIISELLQQPSVIYELREGGFERASRVEQLSHLGLLYENHPTMGLFLCCAPRSDIVSKFSCGLSLVAYSETKRANAKPRISRAKGNLLSLFDRGMQFFDQESGLARTGRVGSTYRDDLEIPERALREALVNALIHRDYETVEGRSQPTRVEVYPDRVEISSYGGLMPGISLTAMNEAAESVHHVRRNEIITDIFAYFQHAELNASGIARIHHDVRERDLPKPLIELVECEKLVRIVLYRPLPEASEYSKNVSGESISRGQPTALVSSTAQDLPEHRAQMLRACERVGFEPHEAMEHLNALDSDAVEALLEMVNRADVYIGIFAYRYGYVPNGADISVAEMEYNRAVELKKPRLIFIMDDDHPISPGLVEIGEGAVKLEALKKRIGKDRVVDFFKSPGDLRARVIEALVPLRKEFESAHQPAKVVAPLKVYVVGASDDANLVHQVTGMLIDAHGLNAFPCGFQGAPDEIRRLHEEEMREADAVLYCWGKTSDTSIQSYLREARFPKKFGRDRPFRAIALFLGPPINEYKKRFRSGDMNMLLGPSDEVRPELFAPLVEALNNRSDPIA